MSHDPAEIDKHVRTYVLVFVALMVLTVITVGISYLHLTPPLAIGFALLVATVKGSLVAGFFMHLVDERKLIYWVMGLTVAFFLFVLLIPAVTEGNNIHLGG